MELSGFKHCSILKDIAAASLVVVIVRKEQKPLVMRLEFQAARDLDVE